MSFLSLGVLAVRRLVRRRFERVVSFFPRQDFRRAQSGALAVRGSHKFPALPRSLLYVALCTLLCACDPQVADPLQAFEQGDYALALQLWLPRAEEGDTEAQNYIGIQHYLGLGVERDRRAAFEWFSMAAKQGYPDAQRNLGTMYRDGQAVQQDFYAAFVWLFAASRQGSEDAARHLGSLSGENKLSPNQQLHAMLEANAYIPDSSLHFTSRDNYIERGTTLLR